MEFKKYLMLMIPRDVLYRSLLRSMFKIAKYFGVILFYLKGRRQKDMHTELSKVKRVLVVDWRCCHDHPFSSGTTCESARYIVGDIMHDSERGYKFEMERLIERHNLKERVILTGFRKDVFSILGNLDIIVHASIEPESLGMVILEAMSMEKPVVATNVGGVPELIVDGVNGFLVPPNNPERLAEAVCILLKNPNLMIKMGKEGKRIVSEKFNSDINIEKLNGVYKDLLEK